MNRNNNNLTSANIPRGTGFTNSSGPLPTFHDPFAIIEEGVSLFAAMEHEQEHTFEDSEANELAPDPKSEFFVESIEASIGYESLIRQLSESVRERITFFRSEAGGSLNFDEALKVAFKKCMDVEEAKTLFDWLLRAPVDIVSFYELAKLWDIAPRAAEKVWKLVKVEARNEFESGHMASRSIFPTSQLRKAWDVAKYIAIRESFIEEWRPKGGIELSLIDMLTQAFSQWNYWLEQVTLRSQTSPRSESPEYRRWLHENQKSGAGKSWDSGEWFPRYVEEQEELEKAVQMADRWQRIYLRTLRHLRDQRRFGSVTINNAKQVNIATDNGKQSNVAE